MVQSGKYSTLFVAALLLIMSVLSLVLFFVSGFDPQCLKYVFFFLPISLYLFIDKSTYIHALATRLIKPGKKVIGLLLVLLIVLNVYLIYRYIDLDKVYPTSAEVVLRQYVGWYAGCLAFWNVLIYSLLRLKT